MGSLTGVGYLWVFLSIAATVLCTTGFYLPFWIQGKLLGKVDAYFSSFRRCNYPKLNPHGVVEIVLQCARYSRWRDIPSEWWKASTALLCLGCLLTILVAVMAISACCLDHVIHSASAKIAASMHLLAVILMCAGLVMYPLGWDNREIRDCCGPAARPYSLGSCRLSWSVHLLCAGLITLFICCFIHKFIYKEVNS